MSGIAFLKTRRAYLLGIITFCAWFSWNAAVNAVAQIVRIGNAPLALKLVGDDPVALAVEADRLLSANAKQGNQALVVDFARASLVAQGVNARALRILSMTKLGTPSDRQAEPLLKLSEKLSRRDLGTQLLLIENAVLKNNVPAILAHYDKALRTSADARNLLFPQLTAALDEPEVQRGMSHYVRMNVPWLHDFLLFATSSGQRPQNLATTLMQAKGLAKDVRFREIESLLLWQLVDKATPQEIQRYYLTLTGSSPARLTSIDFTNESVNPQRAPVSWAAIKAGDVTGAFIETNQGAPPVLQGVASSGNNGLIAQKMLFLMPGTYRIKAQFEMLQMASDAAVKVLMTCVKSDGNQVIWTSDIRTLADSDGITIIEDCKAQFLDIQMYGGDGQSDSEMRINALTLGRAT